MTTTMNELMLKLYGKEIEQPKKSPVTYSARELAASKAVLDNLLATRALPVVAKTA